MTNPDVKSGEGSGEINLILFDDFASGYITKTNLFYKLTKKFVSWLQGDPRSTVLEIRRVRARDGRNGILLLTGKALLDKRA